MAQGKENPQTFGKTKNSKVYIAKPANSFDKDDEHETEFPRRDSVLQMKSVFEKSRTEDSAGKSHQAVVLKGNVEISAQCFPETPKSVEIVAELGQWKSPNVHSTWNSQPLPQTLNSLSDHNVVSNHSNHSLNQSETKSCVTNTNIVEQKFNDSSDLNIGEGQGSKDIRPGSLLLQPASNVRGPMPKPEYLKLNKFNDITVYPSSQKRSKVNVDELDKKMECLPVTAIDDVLVDNSLDDTDDPQTFDSDLAFEFEGADVKVNRPALKTCKSYERKQVSFSHHLESVFEYPAEQTSQLRDSEVSNCNHSKADGDSIPEKVNSKALQSSLVCNGTGHLGLYQPRLLEHCSAIPFYSTDTVSQQTNTMHSQPMEKYKAKVTVVGSCSAEESSWSGGNSGTEMLF